MITHTAREAWVQDALKQILDTETVTGNPVVIRIEDNS
jgi:hypothetical protein